VRGFGILMHHLNRNPGADFLGPTEHMIFHQPKTCRFEGLVLVKRLYEIGSQAALEQSLGSGKVPACDGMGWNGCNCSKSPHSFSINFRFFFIFMNFQVASAKPSQGTGTMRPGF